MPNGEEVNMRELSRSQKVDRVLRICGASITILGGIISTVMTVVDSERKYQRRLTRKPRRRVKRVKAVSVRTVKSLPAARKEKARRLKRNGKSKKARS